MACGNSSSTTRCGVSGEHDLSAPGTSPWAQFVDTYAGNENLIRITNPATCQTGTCQYKYYYNARNALSQEATWNGTTIGSAYGALGNRLTQTVVPSGGTPTTTAYGYDREHNQLIGLNGASVTNDAARNVTSGGTNTYTWNAANQLATVMPPNGSLGVRWIWRPAVAMHGQEVQGIGKRISVAAPGSC